MIRKIREGRKWLKNERKKGKPLLTTLVREHRLPWRHRRLLRHIKEQVLKPLKTRRILAWETNKKKIELEITTACNLRCHHCDRSVRQAPSNERMSTDQVRKFVKESLKNRWEWWNIFVIGGEPTLHPELFEILEILKEYKKRYPHCRVELVTNGHGKYVQEQIKKVPKWVVVRNSSKESNEHPHETYNVAPIDTKRFKKADFTKGCWITEGCGIGLTRYGYYPCGAGGSVDRIFGFDIGVKNLSKLTDKKIRKQKKILCRLCGHFKSEQITKPVNKDVYSPRWQKAYARYKEKKPELTEY